MTKERKILIAVCVLVAFLLLVQLVTLFRATRQTDHSAAGQIIAAKDETIKAIQETREAWQKIAEEKQQSIRELERRDSMLTIHYLDNQAIYKSIDAKIKNIPVYIQRIAGNDDSIRRAFADF